MQLQQKDRERPGSESLTGRGRESELPHSDPADHGSRVSPAGGSGTSLLGHRDWSETKTDDPSICNAEPDATLLVVRRRIETSLSADGQTRKLVQEATGFIIHLGKTWRELLRWSLIALAISMVLWKSQEIIAAVRAVGLLLMPATG